MCTTGVAKYSLPHGPDLVSTSEEASLQQLLKCGV